MGEGQSLVDNRFSWFMSKKYSILCRSCSRSLLLKRHYEIRWLCLQFRVTKISWFGFRRIFKTNEKLFFRNHATNRELYVNYSDFWTQIQFTISLLHYKTSLYSATFLNALLSQGAHLKACPKTFEFHLIGPSPTVV